MCPLCTKPSSEFSKLCSDCIDVQETKREQYKEAMDPDGGSWCYKRGLDDGCKQRSPLWERKRYGITTDIDCHLAEDWSDTDREDYVKGYDVGYEQSF